MNLPQRQPLFDAQVCLAWEAEQFEKHEYLNGEVFAIEGASEAHVTVALNMAMALRTHLRGDPCSVFISDMKLQVQANNAFFYPDVLVTCAESDRVQSLAKSVPTLMAEVLSPATGGDDRGSKLSADRKLPAARIRAHRPRADERGPVPA